MPSRLPTRSAAQLMISCVRTVVVDSDDEGRTRQLPQLQGRQADAVVGGAATAGVHGHVC